MKISKAIGATAALGLLAAGFVAAPAQADTVGTVTVHVQNRADSGHGDPAVWAHDTWDRTATIESGSTEGTYTVTLSGTGTFKTVKGAGDPSGSGQTIARKVTGNFSENLTASVTGTPKGKTALANVNGDTVGGKSKRAAAQAFIAKLFKQGATVTTTGYTYVYENGTCEKWTDSDSNGDGTVNAGSITGAKCAVTPPTKPPFEKSVLNVAAKCRYSKSDKREAWNVSNVAGGRTRTFWLHVSYNGKTTYEGEHTVAAGETNPVTTAHGGKLKLGYYDGAAHHIVKYAWSNAKMLCK